jgi:hypothetical protein
MRQQGFPSFNSLSLPTPKIKSCIRPKLVLILVLDTAAFPSIVAYPCILILRVPFQRTSKTLTIARKLFVGSRVFGSLLTNPRQPCRTCQTSPPLPLSPPTYFSSYATYYFADHVYYSPRPVGLHFFQAGDMHMPYCHTHDCVLGSRAHSISVCHKRFIPALRCIGLDYMLCLFLHRYSA